MILITTVSKSVSRETKRQLSNTVAALMPWPRDNQSATEQLMELLILEKKSSLRARDTDIVADRGTGLIVS
jgi:hypothetical protein